MYKCRKCDNDTIIQVAVADRIPFYACHSEDCEWHAQLLIRIDDDANLFVRYDVILDTFTDVISDKYKGDNEQDNL